MKTAILALLIFHGVQAQTMGVEIIHSRWGTTTHRQKALYRAMIVQRQNTCYSAKAGDDCLNDPQLLDFQNRLEASKADVRLPEIVSVQINKALDGEIVINLTDIDGNKSSIWTTGHEDGVLRVTGVEPY